MTDPQEVNNLTVEAVLDRPGLRWTPAERAEVKAWLCEDKQWLRTLLYIAYRKGLKTDDAQREALQEFVVRELDYTINMYDPTRPGASTFLSFLGFCFGRFCVRAATSMRRKAEVERSLDEGGEDETGAALAEVSRKEFLNFQSGSPSGRSPVKDLYSKEIVNEVCAELSRVSPAHRQMFIMRDSEELSYEEIAAALGAPVNTVKTTVHRVRRRLRNRLLGKGIRP